MSVQDDINKAIDKMAEDVMASSLRVSDETLDNIDSLRNKVRDLLDEYAKEDGTISKARLRKLLRELDDIESDIFDEFDTSIEEAIENVVTDVESNLTGILIASIGVALLYGSARNKPSSSAIVDEVFGHMFDTEIDGVSLSDRITASAGVLRDEVQLSIRYGVNRNENTTQISRRIKKAFDDTAWQFKRIMTTELPIAFRKTIVTIGGNTGIVKAVKIIDNRGRHKNHERHMCYKYAEDDKYGWGKGVYKTTDTFILNPHPQCSAYFHYILDDKKLRGVGNDAE